MLPFVPCSQLREFLAAGGGDEQLIQVVHCCQIRGRSSREGGGGLGACNPLFQKCQTLLVQHKSLETLF